MGLFAQIIHSKINPLRFPARYLDIPWFSCSTGKRYSIISHQQLVCPFLICDFFTKAEAHALLFHKGNTAFDNAFIQLHIGDSIHQKSPSPVCTFIYRYRMPSVIQLISQCKSAGTAADHSNPFAAANNAFLRLHESVCVGIFRNGIFVIPYAHGIRMKRTGTGLFTGGRTDAGGEFRKIICFLQALKCDVQMIAIYHIIPFRYQIVQRTAGNHTGKHHTALTKGYSAIHTACCLLLPQGMRQGRMKFMIAFDPCIYIQLLIILPLIFHKSCFLSHKTHSYLHTA